MKKLLLLGLLVVLGTFGSSASALSCAEFPTFMEMYDRAAIIITGEVTAIDHEEDMSEADYCESVGGAEDSSKLGTHTFTLDVDGDTYQVSKEVTGINCTRGGSCVDMEIGKEYVVLTDPTMTLQDGLCGPCPYMLKSEFDALQNDTDEEMCICTMEYDPVCGTNGETYGNNCGLECEGATLDYRGECGTDAPEIIHYNDIPNSCTSRYDGCNTCGVENGQATFCTEMACFQQQRSKCLQHDFSILNDASVAYIQKRLDQHLAGRTPENREARVQVLIKRIDDKLTELQGILMISIFPVGSEQLKNITLTIEVLEALDSML